MNNAQSDTLQDSRMTPEAKAKLRKVIRGTENGTDKGLRGALLLALREETEREYQLSIGRVQNTSLNEERRAKRRRLETWLDEQTRAETGKHKRSTDDFLRQGDSRGWRKRGHGTQPPQPGLARWNRDRLKHSIELLNDSQRDAVEKEVERLSNFRDWRVWARSARTNHVHVVVTAAGFAGSKVRDQLKANCTRVLREGWPMFVIRPVWTTGGDWQCINSEEDLEQVVLYVNEAQDRMGLGK